MMPHPFEQQMKKKEQEKPQIIKSSEYIKLIS